MSKIHNLVVFLLSEENMTQNTYQPSLPGFGEKSVKSPVEILESKVRLHFHEITLSREIESNHEKRIKELEAAFTYLYMKNPLSTT